MKHKVDVIIIGGGLAGTNLALTFIENGISFAVIDKEDPESASRVASGIINPITGRRFVKSWLYDQLEAFLVPYYSKWEENLNTRFFKEIKIYRSIPDNRLVNDLDAKLANTDYSKYCRPLVRDEEDELKRKVNFKPPGYLFLGYQVNTSAFLDAARIFIEKNGFWENKNINPDTLKVDNGVYSVSSYYSERVVLACGARALENGWFDWAGLNPNRGEVLKIFSKKPQMEDLLKQRVFLVPEGKDLYWVGSYSTWEPTSSERSEEGKMYLTHHLEGLVEKDYEIRGHLAAFRPAITDRRPIIGQHPQQQRLYVFNGFGSKGTSLIPFFADHFYRYLFGSQSLLDEVNVDRYL